MSAVFAGDMTHPALRRCPSALRLLYALHQHVSPQRRACWPSQRRLLRLSGIGSFSTLQRAKQALIAAGFIEATDRRVGPDRNKATRYVVRFAAWTRRTVAKVMQAIPETLRRARQATQEALTPRSGLVTRLADAIHPTPPPRPAPSYATTAAQRAALDAFKAEFARA